MTPPSFSREADSKILTLKELGTGVELTNLLYLSTLIQDPFLSIAQYSFTHFQRDLSTCGALDSITEGDEEEEEAITESADEENQEDTSLLQGMVSPPSPPLPLWQQKLRSRERGLSNPMTVSPTLEERLMRISSDSNSSSSDMEDSGKQDIPFDDTQQGFECLDELDLEMKTNYPEMNRTTASLGSGLFAQNLQLETSFCDTTTDKDDEDYGDRTNDGSATQVQMNTVITESTNSLLQGFGRIEKPIFADTSQSKLSEGSDKSATIIDNPYFMNNYENGSSNTNLHNDSSGTGDMELRVEADKVPSIMCRSRAKHRYSLPELANRPILRYSATAGRQSAEMCRSSSFSNSRRRQCGVLRKSRLINEKSDAFEPLPEDRPVLNDEDTFDCKTDSTYLNREKRYSSDMSWDVLGNSQRNGETASVKSVEDDNGEDELSPGIKTLQLPGQTVERMSSGIFSRDHSDSDSDSESSICGTGRHRLSKSSQYSGQNGMDQGVAFHNTSDGSVPVMSARKRRLSNVDLNPTMSSNYEVEYLTEMRLELTNEVRSTRKSLEGIEKVLVPSKNGNSFLNIGCLAEDLTESKAAVEDVSLKIDHLSNDVSVLKKEVRSLTALVRLLVEQQNSLR